jgi:hypothetical protein
MGAWSGEPFGNDTAADWAWEVGEADSWQVVRDALNAALAPDDYLDEDLASVAIAAAEVVAIGLGRGTQDDAYTQGLSAFAARASTPPADLVKLAIQALAASTGSSSGLAALWSEADPTEWQAENARLSSALAV